MEELEEDACKIRISSPGHVRISFNFQLCTLRMASTKRELPYLEEVEPQSRKAKLGAKRSNSSVTKANVSRVVINPADCDLDFDIEEDGLTGSALHKEGFAYCWSGARANVGITGGKYCFGCKVISAQAVEMEDTPPDQQHVCRLGVSRGDSAVSNLGETLNSFGFGGTGKFSTAGSFVDYGEKFGVGDTIVCAVDLDSKSLASLGFSRNGKWLGKAKEFNAALMGLGATKSPVEVQQWESALYPHVLLKNVVVQMQFSIEEGLVPEEGYKPWASAISDGNAKSGPTFPAFSDCEVMMMVGLPASGKSTWAEKWVKEHPEKRYVLLGTNLILDRMKVPGLLRKHNYGERFDRLMGRANAIFDTLLSKAARTPRNYIIDQTNVYKSARKRKLRPFASFHKIAVVVFPKPEELKIRAEKRFQEMGKEVPADAVNNMLANYVLPMSNDMPGSDEAFDEVIFVELGRGESQKHLEEMKRALKTGSTAFPLDTSPHEYTNYTAYSQDSVDSYTRPPFQNQGILPVGAQNWQCADLPASLQLVNPPSHPLYPRYQHPIQMNMEYGGPGPTPQGSFQHFYPSESYLGSHATIPGSVAHRNVVYGAAESVWRQHVDERHRIVGSVATSDRYSSMCKPILPGVATTSHVYNTSQARPRYPGNFPPSSYGVSYGTPGASPGPYLHSTLRPADGTIPAGMQHSGTSNSPQTKYYY